MFNLAAVGNYGGSNWVTVLAKLMHDVLKYRSVSLLPTEI